MDCTFSNPVVYDGTPPTTTLDTWNFQSAHCTPFPTATPSAVVVASPAAYVDIASSSAIAHAMTGTIEIQYTFDLLVLIALAIMVGVWAFSHG